MALRIPVQKDIGEYSEKIVGGLSLRTMACGAIGLAVGGGVYAATAFGLGLDTKIAVYPTFIAAVPAFACAFWKPFGMKLEALAPLVWRHAMEEETLLYAPCAPRCESGVIPGTPKGRARKAPFKRKAEARGPYEQ